MRDWFGIFGTVTRFRELSLLLVMMLRIPNKYGGFNDVAMGGDNEEEVAADDDRGDDAFGDAIRDAQRECESVKEKAKFERMLEDHRKSLYPIAEEGQKKLGTTLKLLQWKAKNGTSDKAFG